MFPLNGGKTWLGCGQCNGEDHVPHTRTGHYNNYSEFSLDKVIPPHLVGVLISTNNMVVTGQVTTYEPDTSPKTWYDHV